MWSLRSINIWWRRNAWEISYFV